MVIMVGFKCNYMHLQDNGILTQGQSKEANTEVDIGVKLPLIKEC